ncbi:MULTISPECIES: LacI family DNA-binding transcriptional regulator [Bifidobacterium]|uniref:LacI family transcriptional regulator n=2 Tax=Bifidobacterium TaxID=1678 RepID=A0A2M9HP47_9BIFI|nr:MULTISPECIES: LacI family DNA-binding transcriptional regulator [Bifidobacterium]NMM98378.1 LacI family transcriptional regulator [Bifidobacterium sp. DSM 109959]PJM78598.1 LacI family transcriptional regulator [Bifidobacterium scaligerum]
MKRATIADVAKLAGVSTFTVSRALHGRERVAESTRQRVVEAAKALNYTTSKSAAALANGRTQRIALLISESLSSSFNGHIQDGLYDVLRPANYDLLVYRAGGDTERADFFQHLPADRNADALIVSFSVTDEEQRTVTSMGMPIVTVNALNNKFTQGSVSIDDIKAEGEAVRYLHALGHKRFCFVDKQEHLWGVDHRILGYRQAIDELGLEDCGTLTIDNNPYRPARRAVAQLLAMPQRPTAICGWSDQYAEAMLVELFRCGIRVPDEISVIGFDAFEPYRMLGLSSVEQPARRIGQIAAEKALALINEEKLDEPHTVVPTTILPGETTGPCPEDSDA